MSPVLRPSLTLGCTAVMLALSAPPIGAAEPPAASATAPAPAPARAASKAGARPGPRTPARAAAGHEAAAPLLTRAELRACIEQQGKLQALRSDLSQQQAALARDEAEIQRAGQALKDDLATLDRTSEPAVTAYQARAAAQDKLIDSYNARLPAFNTAAGALQGEEQAFAKNCAGRSFEEGDELAIKRARKQ